MELVNDNSPDGGSVVNFTDVVNVI